MKTLVTDPFEDDVVSILEWAYGRDARRIFAQFHNVQKQRVGQAFMNTLRQFDYDGYCRILGKVGDPFYNDKKIPDALDILTNK